LGEFGTRRTEITRRNPIHTEPARMRLNDYGRISKPAGCRQSCNDYGNGGKIESEKRAKLEEPDLQTGAGLEPSLTEPANINPIRADSVRKRTAGTLHDDSNPIHALKQYRCLKLSGS
jgi:hypothetical protein